MRRKPSLLPRYPSHSMNSGTMKGVALGLRTLKFRTSAWNDLGSRLNSCIIAKAVANTIFQTLSDFFARYGYWTVFFGVMLENIGVPLPGETVLLFAGFLSYQGKVNILPAMATALAGATVGACLGYALGRFGGTSAVHRIVKRFPRIGKSYDEAHNQFLKYGRWAVFVARFIAGLRMFAGILAGTLNMPFGSFLFYSFAGAVCWSLVIGYVGFAFGSNWGALVALVGRMNRIALVAIAACVLVLLLARSLHKRKVS